MYRSLATLWIIFGLAWLALVLNVVAELVEKLIEWRMLKREVIKEETAVQKVEDHPIHVHHRIRM